MGQQCIRDGSDDERPAAAMSSKPSGKANKYEASDRIVSLEHVEHPHSKLCESSKVEKNFREFSRILAAGEAALSVVSCDTFSGGAKQLLMAGEDKMISLLNYETGHVMKQWKKAHERDINAMTNPLKDSGIFCSCSRDATLRLWKPSENAPLHILKGHKLNVTSVSMHPEGRLLASGSRDNTVRLWDTESGALLDTQDVKLNIVHFVRFLVPMNCIVQGGEDLTLRLWDLRGEGHKRTLELKATHANFDYHPTCCEGYWDSSDRAHTLFTGHNGFNNQGSMIIEWDLRMGKQVREFDGHGFSVRALRLLRSETISNGTRGQLLSASDDGSLRLWPVDHHQPAAAAEGHVTNASEAAPASAAASATVGADGRVHVRDSRRYELQEGRVTSVDETADGLLLLSLRNGSVVILKNVGTPEDPRPVQRYRYVGNPGAAE